MLRIASRSVRSVAVRTGSNVLALGLLAGLLAGPSALPARADVVVPSSLANTEGGGGGTTVGPLASSAYTVMELFGASELTALTAGTQITGIGFRLNGGQGSVASVSFADYDIYLGQLNSAVTNPAQNGGTGGYSTTFANNYQTGTRLQVRGTSGTSDALTLTNLTGGAGPNPFFTIAFATPYTYQGGGLVVEIRHTAGDGGNLPVDASNGGTTSGSVLNNTTGNTATTVGATNSGNTLVTQLQFATIPEPGTFALLGTGLGMGVIGAAGAARRRRQSH